MEEKVVLRATGDSLQREYREYLLLREELQELDPDDTLFSQFNDGVLKELDEKIMDATKRMRRARLLSAFSNLGVSAASSMAYNEGNHLILDKIPDIEIGYGIRSKDAAYVVGWAVTAGVILLTSFYLIRPPFNRYENKFFVERSNHVSEVLPFMRNVAQELRKYVSRT